MTRLKEQIATRTYHVDSRAVAREMLFKMRMMALVREEPGTAGNDLPSAQLPGPTRARRQRRS